MYLHQHPLHQQQEPQPRQEVKELLAELEQRYPDLKKKLFGAMQRYPLYGWDLENMEK